MVTVALPHRHTVQGPPRVHRDEPLVDVPDHRLGRPLERIPVPPAAWRLQENLVSGRHDTVDELRGADRPVHFLKGAKGGVSPLLDKNRRVVGVPAPEQSPWLY